MDGKDSSIINNPKFFKRKIQQLFEHTVLEVLIRIRTQHL